MSADRALGIAVELLKNSKILLVTDSCNDYSENSGVINLIGVLKSIDEGIIKDRENVLVAITGGVSSNMKINNKLEKQENGTTSHFSGLEEARRR